VESQRGRPRGFLGAASALLISLISVDGSTAGR
jgi:hypothetical protein